jgi:hypothetical protein
MGKKIIIGLMGEDVNLREKVAKIFSDIGFFRTSISSKTTELANYLLPGDIFPEETVDQIRQRGYKVSNCYWINLVLASTPDDKDLILIDDLRQQDIIEGVIIPYIVETDDIVSYGGIEAINANSKNIEAEIHSKIKKIAV